MSESEHPLKITQQIIYIAGPYTAENDEQVQINVDRAIEAGIEVWDLGHIPLIPHQNRLMELALRRRGRELMWEDWMAMDAPLLDVSDAILILASSPGVNFELEKAKKAGKEVYTSLADIRATKKTEVLEKYPKKMGDYERQVGREC